ncbi:16S rRNA pseudouridine516 synthase [Hathewaya proteolytica DSM 3090]|uniref:Pseudouridine synthase n=1 Tax=Hathewaya proteolytica DSM 3090 TaxID=1121331 RepID=A0A1M6NVQ0_9CLOT|nr:pseudouridine synthase [Hathewaya proteolytica]SHJ99766.1 16S rRNA pseudouridine516 synthase [Hathewaya proteolytica DSM 3090]
MERLDKVLSNAGYGSRKEIKELVKKGRVEVSNAIIKDSSIKVDVQYDEIKIDGVSINYRKYIYLIMNKPAGVVSATFDNYDETVIDLLDEKHQHFQPFPIGRLDKDTVGLLLLTNDGDLNHKLISPKYHVDKVYYAHIKGVVDEEDIESFQKGITLDDGYVCMPGILEIIKSGETSEVYVTIQEGKFHQVKRMFKSLGKEVTFLKRIKFGEIVLDEGLEEGCYRELNEKEMALLQLV